MEKKRENLEKELSQINVAREAISAMNELCYTAQEAGLIPFKIRDEHELIIKLAILAEKYKGNLPETLKT